MTIHALAFDIGGVLERVEDPDDLLARWRHRVGLDHLAFDDLIGKADRRHRTAARLSRPTDRSTADSWPFNGG